MSNNRFNIDSPISLEQALAQDYSLDDILSLQNEPFSQLSDMISFETSKPACKIYREAREHFVLIQIWEVSIHIFGRVFISDGVYFYVEDAEHDAATKVIMFLQMMYQRDRLHEILPTLVSTVDGYDELAEEEEDEEEPEEEGGENMDVQEIPGTSVHVTSVGQHGIPGTDQSQTIAEETRSLGQLTLQPGGPEGVGII